MADETSNNSGRRLHQRRRHPIEIERRARARRERQAARELARLCGRDLYDLLSDVQARIEPEPAHADACARQARGRLESLALAQHEVNEVLPGADLQTVLRTIVEHARRLTGAELAVIGVAGSNGDFDTWIYSGTTAVDARRPYPLPGAAHRDAPAGFLELAVRYRDKVVGRLYLTDKRGAHDFSAEDAQMLELLAARIGPAMELARLRDAEARERARLDLVNEIGRALSETLDYRGVLDRVVQAAVPRLGDCCILYVLEEGVLRPAAYRHVDPAMEPLVAALQADPRLGVQSPRATLARVFATGEAVFEPDYDLARALAGAVDDPELRRQIEAVGPRSLMVLPFSADDRVFGLAALAYCQSGRRYETSDLALARAVFDRAAAAIENARLYRREQEAVRARDDLLAVVAHDLRNPLTSVYTAAQLLELQPDPPLVRKQAENLLNAARRMRRLVDDLLDAAALDAGAITLDVQAWSAAELVDEALTYVEPQLAAGGIRLERELPAEPLPARCDRERTLEVLGNLLGNAAKFTGAGGTIRVSVRRDGGQVTFAVSDTGPGIPVEQHAHLFDRFWKGQQHGTGLGLYIAKRILDAQGSCIHVDSARGRGSTFSFALPAA